MRCSEKHFRKQEKKCGKRREEMPKTRAPGRAQEPMALPAGLEGVLLGKDSQLQPPARVSETATESNQTAERNPSGQRSD